MISQAGGALGAAAGAAIAGPVGGIAGNIVAKKTVGKWMNKDGAIVAENAPGAVGAYPHARRMGNLLFISGVGPRSPVDNSIPGGPSKMKMAILWNMISKHKLKPVSKTFESS